MNVEEMELWFTELCRQVEGACNTHVFGGSALALKRLKAVTKDVDLMFESREERSAFEKALQKRGYQLSWKGHEASDHTGWSLKTGGETHLYFPGPHPFTITPSMIKRSTPYLSLPPVNVFILAPEDLLLLKTYPRTTSSDKAAYMRPDDVSDIEALLTMKLDWKTIQKEIDTQARKITKDPSIRDKNSAYRIATRFYLALSSLKSRSKIPVNTIAWAKRRSRHLERHL